MVFYYSQIDKITEFKLISKKLKKKKKKKKWRAVPLKLSSSFLFRFLQAKFYCLTLLTVQSQKVIFRSLFYRLVFSSFLNLPHQTNQKNAGQFAVPCPIWSASAYLYCQSYLCLLLWKDICPFFRYHWLIVNKSIHFICWKNKIVIQIVIANIFRAVSI